jgi:hypothetical protein
MNVCIADHGHVIICQVNGCIVSDLVLVPGIQDERDERIKGRSTFPPAHASGFPTTNESCRKVGCQKTSTA